MRDSAVMVLGALAFACAPALHHPTYAPQPSDALVAVTQPPPPARVEVLPVRPSEQAVWVDGQWVWRRGRWAWLSGRWVAPPQGAVFLPWVFVRGADGHLWYAPGTWHDAAGAVIQPPPLAMASVEGGAVVDAEGLTETTGPILHDHDHSH